MQHRILRRTLALVKFVAVMAGVFMVLATFGYFLLVVWDRTHLPFLPGGSTQKIPHATQASWTCPKDG